MAVERNKPKPAHPAHDEKTFDVGQNHGSGLEQSSSEPKQGTDERQEDRADRIQQDPCTDINPTGWPGVKPQGHQASLASPRSEDTGSVNQGMPDKKAAKLVSSEPPAATYADVEGLDANSRLDEQHHNGKEARDVPSTDTESGG